MKGLEAIAHAYWQCDQPVTPAELAEAAKALGLERYLPDPKQMTLYAPKEG